MHQIKKSDFFYYHYVYNYILYDVNILIVRKHWKVLYFINYFYKYGIILIVFN